MEEWITAEPETLRRCREISWQLDRRWGDHLIWRALWHQETQPLLRLYLLCLLTIRSGWISGLKGRQVPLARYAKNGCAGDHAAPPEDLGVEGQILHLLFASEPNKAAAKALVECLRAHPAIADFAAILCALSEATSPVACWLAVQLRVRLQPQIFDCSVWVNVTWAEAIAGALGEALLQGGDTATLQEIWRNPNPLLTYADPPTQTALLQLGKDLPEQLKHAQHFTIDRRKAEAWGLPRAKCLQLICSVVNAAPAALKEMSGQAYIHLLPLPIEEALPEACQLRKHGAPPQLIFDLGLHICARHGEKAATFIKKYLPALTNGIEKGSALQQVMTWLESQYELLRFESCFDIACTIIEYLDSTRLPQVLRLGVQKILKGRGGDALTDKMCALIRQDPARLAAAYPLEELIAQPLHRKTIPTTLQNRLSALLAAAGENDLDTLLQLRRKWAH